ncbi:MAG TPA: hypothetical protein VG895_05565 [Patescibacteria group bacterium]|nr:hypothetical protein [Gammaproteobacteria bacterium]HWA52484.1 hypothetical protein [Patescibacteria group bacterium]
MRIIKFKPKNQYRLALDCILFDLYKQVLKEEPKSEDMSQSLYLTCVAIRILEKTGNSFPSQVEIDAVEANVKRYSNRKSIKLSLKKAA